MQLAGFIFGKNSAQGAEGNEKVAMTSPVATEMPPDFNGKVSPISTYAVSWFMPALDANPVPTQADLPFLRPLK